MFVLGLHTRRPDEAGGAGGREGGKEAASTLRHLCHVTSSSGSGKLFQFIRSLGHKVAIAGQRLHGAGKLTIPRRRLQRAVHVPAKWNPVLKRTAGPLARARRNLGQRDVATLTGCIAFFTT